MNVPCALVADGFDTTVPSYALDVGAVTDMSVARALFDTVTVIVTVNVSWLLLVTVTVIVAVWPVVAVDLTGIVKELPDTYVNVSRILFVSVVIDGEYDTPFNPAGINVVKSKVRFWAMPLSIEDTD